MRHASATQGDRYTDELHGSGGVKVDVTSNVTMDVPSAMNCAAVADS